MKATLIKITLILVIVFAFSSCKKQKELNLIEKDKVEVSSPEKVKEDKIIGVYYTGDLEYFLCVDLKLRLQKPEIMTLYSLEFKNNGILSIKDLTGVHTCALGLAFFEKAEWKAKGDDIYELTFNGNYNDLENKFYRKVEYRLVDLENGDKELKFVKILETNEPLIEN